MVTNTINNNSNMKPTVCTLASNSGETGFLLIISIIINTICPPSNAGKGSKLIKPTFILKKATKNNKLANPASFCCPTIEYIPTGPDNCFKLIVNCQLGLYNNFLMDPSLADQMAEHRRHKLRIAP